MRAYPMDSERLIRSGVAALGLARDPTKVKISYHSQSLYPLYRVELPEPFEGIAAWAAKVTHNSAMAESEAEGLTALADAGCSVPSGARVYGENGNAVLFMEFVAHGSHGQPRSLLENLGRLYEKTYDSWGWERDNFIGNLPQTNRVHPTFSQFFWENRLEVQLRLALSHGHLREHHTHRVEELLRQFVDEWSLENFRPRLIHGDLWSGNLLPSASGEIYLIDPAVARGHPEQDLAMLQLFGSPLPLEQMEALSTKLGMAPGLDRRIPFWQIYPLLVHINIFGSSYTESLERVLRFYE